MTITACCPAVVRDDMAWFAHRGAGETWMPEGGKRKRFVLMSVLWCCLLPVTVSAGDDAVPALPWQAREAVIHVAGKAMSVPIPPGFVSTPARLQNTYQTLGILPRQGQVPLLALVPNSWNEQLMVQAAVRAAAETLQSGLMASVSMAAGEAAASGSGGIVSESGAHGRGAFGLMRYLWVKAPELQESQTMSLASFQVLRNHVREDHAEQLARQAEAVSSAWSASGPAARRRVWPLHVDEERMLIYSAENRLNMGQAGKEGKEGKAGQVGKAAEAGEAGLVGAFGEEAGAASRALIQTQTLAMLYVADRLLFLQVNGGPNDLAWTRALMQRWTEAILQANPTVWPEPSAVAQASVQAAVISAQKAVQALSGGAGMAAVVMQAGDEPVGASLPVSTLRQAPAEKRAEAPLVSTSVKMLLPGLICVTLLWGWRCFRESRNSF